MPTMLEYTSVYAKQCLLLMFNDHLAKYRSDAWQDPNSQGGCDRAVVDMQHYFGSGTP